MDNREPDLKTLNKAGDNLQNLLDQYGSDKSVIKKEQDTENETYRQIRARLADRLAEIEEVTEKSKDFSKVTRETYKWVVSATEKVEPKLSKPISRDVKKLKEQIEEIEVNTS